MKPSANYILLVLSILILFLSCNKKKQEVTITISDNMKKYGIFQQGSYWIYRNEKSGKLDSSYLMQPPSFYFSKMNDTGIQTDTNWEFCETHFGGSFIFLSDMDTYYYALLIFLGDGGVCLKKDDFAPGLFYLDSHALFRNIKMFDSLLINGNTYYSVMNTQLKQWVNVGDSSIYTFYMAKSVGLVKYEQNARNADTTWSLLRYHVIQ